MVAQTLSQRVNKPKTRRGKKFLEKRSPKVHENPKYSLFVRGGNTSEGISQCLRDLILAITNLTEITGKNKYCFNIFGNVQLLLQYQLRKPEAVMLKRKNPFLPFEDETPIEKFAQKYDASLFVFGSHSKKRPHNLIFGRLYDYHILDMVEFGVEQFIPIEEFKVPKIPVGSKPCLSFSGPEFETEETYKRIKNIFIDFFGGQNATNVSLQGLCVSLNFTVVDGNICIRSYRMSLKKSGTRVPYVHLDEMGPRIDLSLRRNKLASNDLFKLSLKQPVEAKIKTTKNISHDVFGSKLAQIHVGQQNIDRLQTRKLKGLRKSGPMTGANRINPRGRNARGNQEEEAQSNAQENQNMETD